MKPHRSNHLFAALLQLNGLSTAMVVTMTALAVTPAAHAANQTYQDASALNTWNTTDANWDAGVVWTNANSAIFAGTGETVTVTAVTPTAINFNSAGYTLSGGPITLGAATTPIALTANATIASPIAGATNGISKTGVGTLTLSGAQTYTGNTSPATNAITLIGAGGMKFASGFSTTAATTAVSLQQGVSPSNILTIEAGASVLTKYLGLGDSSGASSRVDQTGGSVVVNTAGNNFRVGHWDNGANTGSVYNLSAGTLDTKLATATVSHDGTADVNVGGGAATTTWQAGIINFDAGGADTKVGKITLLSNGVLEVNGAIGTSNSGAALEGIHLAGGTIKTVTASTTNATLYADSSSTIDANGLTYTITGGITGSSNINLSAATGTISFSTTGTQTIAAPLTGSTAITKAGTGTTILSGTSTHTGTLAANAGRLNITGSIASATTTVASGATLNVIGSLGSTNTSMVSGGTLGGEGSVSGTVTPASGSNLSVDPTTAGAITFTNLNLTGQPNIVFSSVPTAGQSPVKLFSYTGTLTSPGGLATDLKGLSGYSNPVITDTAGVVTFAYTTQSLVWSGLGSVWDTKTTANWNSGAQNFAWGDAVTLDDSVGVPTAITLAGELQPGSITVNSNTNNYTLTGSTGNFISGSGNLLKSGSSTLTMNGPNTFTGGVVISQGVIQIQSATALGAGTVTLGDTSTGSSNTALYIDTNRVVFVRPIVIAANGTGTATLGTRSNVGGSGVGNGYNGITLARDVIFDSNAADRTDYSTISGTGNVTITGGGRTVFSNTNTYTGTLTISPSGVGGNVQVGTATAAATNYIPDTTSVTVTDFPGASQAEFRLSSQSETINGLNGNGTVDTNSINTVLTLGGGNGNGSFTGTIQNGGASVVTLTKAGTGAQVLSGTDTYTGVTTINAGVLQFGKLVSLYNNTTASWTPANIKVASGGTFSLNVGGAGEFTNTEVTTLLTNLKTIVSNGLQAGSAVGFDTTNATGGTFTISDIITNSTGTGSGAVGVRKRGAGTLVLSGASSYTGTTNVDAGTLEVTANASGTAKFYSVAQGATLQFGYSTSVGFGYNCGVTVNGTSVADASGLYIKGGQTAQLGGTLTLQTAPSTVRAYGTGNATLSGGDVNTTHLSVATTGSGSVIDSSVNIVCSSFGYRLSTTAGANTATGDVIINSVISGTGSNGNGGPYPTSLRKEGTGSILLTAANTYGNGIIVNGGSVIAGGGDNRLPAAAGVVLNSGTSLKLNGISQTVSNVSNIGTGGSVVGNSATASNLTISSAADATLATLIGGVGTNENNLSLTKAGAGILTLANTGNNYTLGTIINGGTLRVNDLSGTIAGSGAITINSGGTLDGYGTLSSNVTVSAAGGGIAGGIGIGSLPGDILTVGSLTFQGTGAISVLPNVTQVAVTNALTVSGAAGSVAVNIGNSAIAVGTHTLVTHSGPIGGTGISAFTVGTNPGGPFTYSLSDTGSELQLTVTTSALFWNGNNGNEWSLANNWKNGGGSPVTFPAGAAVVFNDDATSLVVDLSTANVAPLSVTFTNSLGFDYTLSGSKAITGSAALLKTGAGVVTIDNVNSFSGNVAINQGTLNAGNLANVGISSALGSGSSIALGGGTLGYTGVAAGSTDRSVDISAPSGILTTGGDLTLTGVIAGASPLVKTGGATLVLDNAGNTFSGSLSVTDGAILTDDAVKLGSGSLTTTAPGGFIFNPGGAATLTRVVGGTGTLTKRDVGTLNISTAGGTILPSTLLVEEGTLQISSGSFSGNRMVGAGSVVISPAGILLLTTPHAVGGDNNGVSETFTIAGTLTVNSEQYISTMSLNGGTINGSNEIRVPTSGTYSVGGSAPSTIAARVNQFFSNALWNVSDVTGDATADLIISGPMVNGFGPIKNGLGTMRLTGINTYTGNTLVNAGTLALADDARLTFALGATSGTSNTLTGAGTVTLDGDFAINTAAATALTTGTWVLENVPSLTGPYGATFTVVNPDGSPWADAGADKWTKSEGSKFWTFDESTGTLTLAVSGYASWAAGYTWPLGADQTRAGDPDGDSFTNLQEFLFGTSPVASNGSLATSTSTGGVITIRWNQLVTGGTYQLLESVTLANPWTLSGAVPANDGAAVGNYQPRKADVTIGAGNKFFRVEGVEN